MLWIHTWNLRNKIWHFVSSPISATPPNLFSVVYSASASPNSNTNLGRTTLEMPLSGDVGDRLIILYYSTTTTGSASHSPVALTLPYVLVKLLVHLHENSVTYACAFDTNLSSHRFWLQSWTSTNLGQGGVVMLSLLPWQVANRDSGRCSMPR